MRIEILENAFRPFLTDGEGKNVEKIYIKGQNISFGDNCLS